MRSRRMLFRLLRAGAVIYAALAVWAEVAHWRSSKRMLGTKSGTGGSQAVVVLGFRNRGSTANFINRYRVRAGIRSLPRTEDGVLVLSGGSVAGDVAEAVLMETYAREVLGYTGRILLDADSRSTWQNIANCVPLIEHADTIKIVSNSPHAEVAREYLWAQRPDLAGRLVRGDEHRFGEIVPIKIAATLRALLFRWRADVAAHPA
ncbi:YdcF family protein [Microbacterium sp.]|uniref:YdcF family protein n=1 Tax=Microbacterium sp. TaxID=51671 RepID=UPI0027329458|nr:YdcF family protein [Microbacterium sp.]